jgi:putative membrane protein insertion efficiency factor
MNPLKLVLLTLLRLYRWLISPLKWALLGPAGRCRYSPSCSAYALQAIQLHGVGHGSRLSLLRLCRCHPWGGSGEDPVPRQLHRDRPSSRVLVRLT